MRVFSAIVVAGLLCLTGSFASAQEVVSKTDPSLIKPCPGTPPAGTLWAPPNVGVARLIPSMPGSDSKQVFWFFRGPSKDDVLTDAQRLVLSEARQGIEKSVAYLFFTPEGTPIEKRLQSPPQEFYNQVIEAAMPPNLRQEVMPCGTVLSAGLTYGTRIQKVNGEDRLVVFALEGPVVVWWYQEGVTTPDGKPGVKVSVTKAVIPTEGPYNGVPVEIVVFEICGNVSGRVAITQETSVTAPMPPAPTPKLVIPPPPPPEQPRVVVPAFPPVKVPPTRKTWNPCGGNKKYICLAAVGLAVGLGVNSALGHNQPTGPVQPQKSGGPGGQPQGFTFTIRR